MPLKCVQAGVYRPHPETMKGCPKDRALVDMAFNGSLVEATRVVSTIRNP